MKTMFFVVSLLPLVAIAGKAEREYIKNKVKPAVEQTENEFKKACGCNMKINYTDTFKSNDELRQIVNIVNSIKDGAAQYCTDADSKKAVCQMKTLEITKTKETKFAFSGSRGTASTDGNSYPSFDMMTPELDK